MSEDLPDFLGGELAPASEIEPAAEPSSPPEAPAAETPEAPVAPVEQPQAEPPPTPAAVEPPAQQHVPLPTFLDLRDKLKAAEGRAQQAEEWRQQQEAQARRQPAPDPFDDPAGAHAHQQATIQSAIYDQNLRMSERLATVTHGPDVVKAAQDWYNIRWQQDPYFNQRVRASDDPFETVITEWKREQLLSKIQPDQLDAFQQWQASQAANPAPGAPAIAPQGQQPQARPQAPRASLASAPSAGLTADPAAKTGEDTFNSMFGGRQ